MLISSVFPRPCRAILWILFFFDPLPPVADQASREEGMQYSQSVDVIIIE